MSRFFTSCGQIIGASASASVLLMNIQDCSPLGLIGLIFFRIDWFDLLSVQGLSRVFSSTTILIFWCSAFFMVQLSHMYMTTRKTIALTIWTFVGKVLSLFFSMLSRLVKAFLPRSNCLLILWQQSPSAVILEPPPKKSVTVSTVSPSICHEVMGPDDLSFLSVEF